MDDLAATRVHVLVVGVPGWPLLRLRARAAVRRRGWLLADGPEDADVLLVCGSPAPVAEAVESLWTTFPVPRARRTALDAAALSGLLDSAARVLADRELQQTAVGPVRRAEPPPPGRLGPLLPDWPPGLVVDLATTAGIVVDAVVTRPVVTAEEDDPLTEDAAGFVQACDRAARVLRLAGWPAAARRLDRSIDRVLAGASPRGQVPQVRAVAARAARSALLHTALGGRGPVDRLLVVLGDAERTGLGEPPVDADLDGVVLADALRGRPVDAARLIVAAAGADAVIRAEAADA